MIAVVEENRAVAAALQTTVAALRTAGESVIRWQAHDEPEAHKPCDGFSDEELADVSAYQEFAQRVLPRREYWPHWYEDLPAAAAHWTGHFAKKIEGETPELLVTWGSSYLGNRAAILAANHAGIPVACVEEGMFRTVASGRQILVTPGKGYYEYTPEEFSAWRTHETDAERLEAYRSWWLAERATKHAHSVSVETELPECWEKANQRLMWFGQLFWDAAAYWGMNDAQKAELQADILSGSDCSCGKAAGAFYKDHPHAFQRPLDPRLHILRKCASIHQLVPRADVVAIVNSTVGVEAMMFREDVPVAVYGDPFYAQEGLVDRTLQAALEAPSHHTKLRHQFLDWLIHVGHVQPNDLERFVAKVRNPEV